jgi:hypothetical protein
MMPERRINATTPATAPTSRATNNQRATANGGGATGASGASPSKAFNPKLIFSQIVAIQCFHYLILGFFFQVNHVLYNTSITIDRIFTDKYLNLWSIGGWADNIAVLLASLVGYVTGGRVCVGGIPPPVIIVLPVDPHLVC